MYSIALLYTKSNRVRNDQCKKRETDGNHIAVT